MPIEVHLNMEAIEGIDVQSGTANIFVSLTLTWNDPRLAWHIDWANCTDVVSMRASIENEKTEIWVPDFDLYNQIDGVQGFPETKAEVYPDGTVEWYRIGPLRVICQFQGLAQIPFDTLGCQLIMGPRERMGFGQLDYQLLNGTGLGFGNFVNVYNEYITVPELSDSGRTADEAAIFYTFYFQRATKHYVSNIVVPTIILTYVSFGTFLLDLRIGERLAYGMSLALVIVAQQIVTQDLIPVSNQRLWIDKFVAWSFYWVCFGLLESVIMGYLFFTRHDHWLLQDTDDGVAEREAVYGLGSSQRFHEKVPREDDRPRNGTDFYVRKPDPRDKVESNDEQFASDPNESPDEPIRKTRFQEPTSNTLDDESFRTAENMPHGWVLTIPLRRVDHACFMLAVVTYTAFLIAMFATEDRWGEQVDKAFITEEDTLL